MGERGSFVFFIRLFKRVVTKLQKKFLYFKPERGDNKTRSKIEVEGSDLSYGLLSGVLSKKKGYLSEVKDEGKESCVLLT